MSDSPSDDSARITTPADTPDLELIRAIRVHAAGHLVFGRFRLLRELGAGGMAVVWLAHDERLGLEVALKFLPGMVAHDPEALHDLRREITRGLRLTHPAIVRLFDFHEDSSESLAAIAMEYIDGSTLADEKARQPDRCFDVAEPLIAWTRTFCEVLSYVHEEARVVHRDLKPRNLMLTRDGKLKVADFGIAATLCDSQSRLTQHPGSSGTPVYMSPQQAIGNQPTAADDIYGFGATMYELLTSKPPFFRGSMSVILNQVASVIPPGIEQRRREFGITGRAPVDPVWEATIMACLEKEQSRRPATMQEVAERLGVGSIATHSRAAGAHAGSVTATSAMTESCEAETVAEARVAIPGKADPIPPTEQQPGKAKRYVLIAALIVALTLTGVLINHFAGRKPAESGQLTRNPPIASTPVPTPTPVPSAETPRPPVAAISPVAATPGVITGPATITGPVVIMSPPPAPRSPLISETERAVLRKKRSQLKLLMTAREGMDEMVNQRVQQVTRQVERKAAPPEERDLALVVRARIRLSALDEDAHLELLDKQLAAKDRATMKQLQATEEWLGARCAVVREKLLVREAEIQTKLGQGSVQKKTLSPYEAELLKSAVGDAKAQLAQAEARLQKAEKAFAALGVKPPTTSPFDSLLDELGAPK